MPTVPSSPTSRKPTVVSVMMVMYRASIGDQPSRST